MGDTLGGITLLKLSPNLTKCGAVPASFPDGKLPKEFEGMPLEEFER